jgi:hypothetical protein
MTFDDVAGGGLAQLSKDDHWKEGGFVVDQRFDRFAMEAAQRFLSESKDELT